MSDPARGNKVDRPFRRDIAGLRAVAVLLVVIGHAGVPWLKGGYVGVDVFLVISGFLITSNLAAELTSTGTIRFARFYSRRMVRLLPASVVVVLFTVVATRHWASPMVAHATSVDAIAAVAYFINMRLAITGTDYFSASEPPTPLQHYWSLSVEEQFYMFWPLILAAGSLIWLRRSRPNMASARSILAVVAVASFGFSVWMTDVSQPWGYFSLPSRAWELALGGLIALHVNKLRAIPKRYAAIGSWLGLGAIVVAGVLYGDGTTFPGVAALLPVVGAGLLIAAGCAQPRQGAIVLLGWRPMQFVGDISYGWYLWHWPVLIIAPYALGGDLGLWSNLGLMFAAMIPAYLSLVLLEDRIRFQPMFRKRARYGLVLGINTTLIGLAGGVVVHKLPTTVEGQGDAVMTAALVASPTQGSPELRRLIARSARVRALPANLDPPLDRSMFDYPDDDNCIAGIADEHIPPGCDRFGVADSERVIVLLGDSHARQWFDAIEAIAMRREMRLVSIVKGGCPASSALIYKGRSERYAECTRWRARAFARINSLKPEWVVMSEREVGRPPMNHRGSAAHRWEAAWRATVRALRPSGARLALLLDTPDPHGVVIPDCLARHRKDIRRCNVPEGVAFKLERRTAARAAMIAAGHVVIDPSPWFCVNGVCPAIIGNTVVYRGKSHITATYARHLARWVAKGLPRTY